MAFVNQISGDPIGLYDILPISVELDEIPAQVGNTLLHLYRYDMADDTNTPVDISSLGAVNSNIVSFTNIWLPTETVANGLIYAGQFRIQGVLTDPTGTVQQATFNYIQPVYAG